MTLNSKIGIDCRKKGRFVTDLIEERRETGLDNIVWLLHYEYKRIMNINAEEKLLRLRNKELDEEKERVIKKLWKKKRK